MNEIAKEVIYSKVKTKAYDGSYRYSQLWYEYDKNASITLMRDDMGVFMFIN